eukprot:COSAG04_NODE_1063_length_8493_cov_6.486181_3_plen_84_part_00
MAPWWVRTSRMIALPAGTPAQVLSFIHSGLLTPRERCLSCSQREKRGLAAAHSSSREGVWALLVCVPGMIRSGAFVLVKSTSA